MNIGVVGSSANHYSGIRAIIEFYCALAKQNHQVIIYFDNSNTNNETLKLLKKNQVNYEIVNSPFSLFLILRKSKHTVLSLHNSNLSIWIACIASGKPVVSTYYGTQLDAFSERIFPQKILKPLETIVNKLVNFLVILKTLPYLFLSDKVVTISKYTASEVKIIFHKKIDYIYLASETTLKNTGEGQEKKFTILSVSRFTPYKGFHRLIKVFQLLKQQFLSSELIIAGSNGYLKYLNYLKNIKSKGIKILHNPGDRILVKLYRDATVYVSFDRFLFFGLPVLEAASFRKPIILLNTAAAGEFVEDGKNGFLFNSESELLEKLTLLIHNPKLIKIMGDNAKKKASFFSWKKTVEKYEKIFEQVIYKRNNWTSLALILAIGLLVRLLFLSQHDIWFDEAVIYFIAKLPLSNLILASASNNTPPLYYLFLHYWLPFSSSTDFLLRLPSFTFGLGSIFLASIVFRNWGSNSEVKTATLFLLFSPFTIYLSSETRYYSLFLFVSLLVLVIYYKFLRNNSFLNFFLLVFSLTLLFYTHFYGLLFIIPVLVLTFEKTFYRNKLLTIILAIIISVLLFLPWILFDSKISHSVPYNYTPIKGLFGMFVAFSLGDLRMPFFASTTPLILKFFFLSIFFLIMFTFLKVLRGGKNIILIAFFIPLFIVFAFSFFLPVFSIRPFIIFAPFFYFLLARSANKTAFTKIIIASFIIVLILQRFNPLFRFEQFQKTAYFLEKNYPDATFVHQSTLSYYPFLFYLPEKTHILVGYNPLSQPTINLIGGKTQDLTTISTKQTVVIYEKSSYSY